MKKSIFATFSICVISLLCAFALIGCERAKTASISENEYNQIREEKDKFFSNYSYTSFYENGEKFIDARCVKVEDTLKMKMQIASMPDTVIYFFDNNIYVDENGDKFCFELNFNLQPDLDNPTDFANKLVYMQYVVQAICFGQEIVSQSEQQIEITRDLSKILKTVKGKEITLQTSGRQTTQQTGGLNVSLTDTKFELKEVFLGSARVKYDYSAEVKNTVTANGEEIYSQNYKQRMLVESVEGDVMLPNLEEFEVR